MNERCVSEVGAHEFEVGRESTALRPCPRYVVREPSFSEHLEPSLTAFHERGARTELVEVGTQREQIARRADRALTRFALAEPREHVRHLELGVSPARLEALVDPAQH